MGRFIQYVKIRGNFLFHVRNFSGGPVVKDIKIKNTILDSKNSLHLPNGLLFLNLANANLKN